MAGKSTKATDAAEKLAQEEGIDPSKVEGTGTDGQVKKEDVEREIAAPPPEPVSVILNPATSLGGYDFGEDVFEVEPKSSIRAGETKVLSQENYERHQRTKVSVGGHERRVITKAP